MEPTRLVTMVGARLLNPAPVVGMVRTAEPFATEDLGVEKLQKHTHTASMIDVNRRKKKKRKTHIRRNESRDLHTRKFLGFNPCWQIKALELGPQDTRNINRRC